MYIVLIVIGLSGTFISEINQDNAIFETIQLIDHGNIALPKNATYIFEIRLRVISDSNAEINGTLNIYNKTNSLVEHWNFYSIRPANGNSEIFLTDNWKQTINNSDESFTYMFLIYSLEGNFSEKTMTIYKNKPDFPSFWDNLFITFFLSGSGGKITSKLSTRKKNRAYIQDVLAHEYRDLHAFPTLWLKTRNFYPVCCEKNNPTTLSIKIFHGSVGQKILYRLTPGISLSSITLLYSLPVLFITALVLYLQNQLTVVGIQQLSLHFIVLNISILVLALFGLGKDQRKYIEKHYMRYVKDLLGSNVYTINSLSLSTYTGGEKQENTFILENILRLQIHYDEFLNYDFLRWSLFYPMSLKKHAEKLLIFFKDGSSKQFGSKYGTFLSYDMVLLEKFIKDFLDLNRSDIIISSDALSLSRNNLEYFSRYSGPMSKISLSRNNLEYSERRSRSMSKISLDFSKLLSFLEPFVFLYLVITGINISIKFLQPAQFSILYFMMFYIGDVLLATALYYVGRLFFTFVDADSERYADLEDIFPSKNQLFEKF